MRNTILVAGLALLGLIVSGCGLGLGSSVHGSGNVITESRPVSEFTAVALSGIGELTIQQTGTESLSVEAEDNILPHLTTTVQGGSLTIGTKDVLLLDPTKPIRYKLTVKDLRAIQLSGAGSVSISDLNTEALQVTVSGAGNMTAAGKATQQTITISGAGNYEASNLDSKTVQVTVSGTGNATVKASGTLDATVSGVGNVVYIGSPTVTQHVSGVGGVRQR